MVRALVLFAMLGAGCLRNAAFPCTESSDCARGGEAGICEPTGFCSFVDPACDGGRRYGELSGGLANQCIGGDPPMDGPPGDTPVTTDSPIDGPPPPPFCDAADATLVGCWEFENVLTDASGEGNNGTLGGNVTFVAGQVGLAIEQDATGHVTVADSTSMQPASLTIEAWISPSIASPTRMGVLDNQNSYGLFVQPNNAGLTCTGLSTTTAIAVDVFTHVACTYQANVANALYINGVQVAIGAVATPLGAGATNGSVIGGDSPGPGDALVGKVDQMRVWNVARTADQICVAAGRTPPCL